MILPTVSHFIQRDILRSLSRNDGQTFSQLQPDGLENGIFSYHLKQLVRSGMVVKQAERYGLSADGQRYVSLATRTNLDILPMPRIFCFLIIENAAGEFIMHRRNAAPFTGQYTFPGGSLFFGESLDELVGRQLIEKIGLSMELEHKGIASIRHRLDGMTVSHSYAHLLHGKAGAGMRATAKDARFNPEWIDPSTLPADQVLSDVEEIISTMRSRQQYFHIELTRDTKTA